MLPHMVLRALVLVLTMILQTATAGVLVHLCAGEIRSSATCCCKRSEPGPGATMDEAHPACCERLVSERASDALSTRDSEQDRASLEAPRRLALAAPKAPSSRWLLDGEENTRRACDRTGHRATAPPLFLRHCSLLI